MLAELHAIACEKFGDGNYAFEPAWWNGVHVDAVHVFRISIVGTPDFAHQAIYVGNLERWDGGEWTVRFMQDLDRI